MPRTEDFRLRDPDAPDWSNITEVKGYTGGGKTSDFLPLARFAGIFQVRHQHAPQSRWYIVNQFLNQDPDTRPLLLAGADEDVSAFAEDGGLAIDTRQLLQLLAAVEAGQLERAAARALLRSQTGRCKVTFRGW